MALEKILKDESIVSIKREDQINVEQVIESVGNELESENPFDCVEMLALFLCIERKKGADSKYAHYLNILPDSFDTVLERWPDKFDEILPVSLIYLKNILLNNKQSPIYSMIKQRHDKIVASNSRRWTRATTS